SAIPAILASHPRFCTKLNKEEARGSKFAGMRLGKKTRVYADLAAMLESLEFCLSTSLPSAGMAPSGQSTTAMAFAVRPKRTRGCREGCPLREERDAVTAKKQFALGDCIQGRGQFGPCRELRGIERVWLAARKLPAPDGCALRTARAGHRFLAEPHRAPRQFETRERRSSLHRGPRRPCVCPRASSQSRRPCRCLRKG